MKLYEIDAEIEPVSYTHLDVYKRQAVISLIGIFDTEFIFRIICFHIF